MRTILEEQVNSLKEHLQEPSLSSDGRFAVFDAARTGLSNVWVIDLETLEWTQVTMAATKQRGSHSLGTRRPLGRRGNPAKKLGQVPVT